MACSKIKAGDLKHPIVIERKTSTRDSMGGFTDVWASIGTTKAKIKPLSGSEKWQAMRISPQARFKVTIRFRGDSDGNPFYVAADRVLYRNHYYAIESSINVEMDSRFLELTIVEGMKS